MLSALTKACRLKNDCLRLRLPINGGMLEVLIQGVQTHFSMTNQLYLCTLYKALFTSTYYGLLRVSEVTSSTHPVLARDVHIATNKDKMLFIIRSSKTLLKGVQPQMVKISSTSKNSSNNKYCSCPFRLLQNYCQKRGGFLSEDEPFFVFKDHFPVKPRHMSNYLCLILTK